MFWRGFAAALVLGALAFYALTIYRTAWTSDDAYITYRVADNFLHGYGLRWNVDERVQAYTHPLWLFLNTAVYALTREIYLSGIALSAGVSLLAAAVLAYALAQGAAPAIFGLMVLFASRAYVDYSTSGLENPLTHLCLALFVWVWLRSLPDLRRVALLSLIAALAALNRMDTLLLFAPALAWAVLAARRTAAFLAAAAGFLPFAAWAIFSVAYYGFPFPNTAYAKLGTGIPAAALAQQGLHYFAHTLWRDPLTLAVILLGLMTPALYRSWRALPLALGIALYLLYIIRIGGDFMGGRYFTGPLFLAVALLVALPRNTSPARWLPAAAAALALTLLAPYPPFLTGPGWGSGPEKNTFKDAHGIGDERRFWYPTTGLAHWRPGKEMPTHSYADTGREYRRMDQFMVKDHGSVGFRGFFGGPKVHIIDWYALADPLLARLPAKYAPNWRIGHFDRVIPAGYAATLESKENQIADPALRTFYDKLSLIVRGPIWSRDRWQAILDMNLRRHDHLIDRAAYRFPGMQTVVLADLGPPLPEGTRWDAEGTRLLNAAGLRIALPAPTHAMQVTLSVDGNDEYHLVFLRGDEELGSVQAPFKRRGGLAQVAVLAPVRAIRRGYDTLCIVPREGDKKYSIGGLRLD